MAVYYRLISCKFGRAVRSETVQWFHLAARFSSFFCIRRRTYCSSDWFLAAARASYSAFSARSIFASFLSTIACSVLWLAFASFAAFFAALLSFFDFLLLLVSSTSASARLRLLFFVVCFVAGASVSEADVGGVLAPDGGTDASVLVAEGSSIVPTICSPFTKKPYRPPRLMPLVRI